MARIRFPMPSRPRQSGGYGRRSSRPMFGSSFKMRLLIAAGLAIFALISYYGSPGDKNQITGEVERVALADERQEMALGAQAAPEMIQQHRGVSRDGAAVDRVHRMGKRLLRGLEEYMDKLSQEKGVELHNPYQFNFTLLADPQTVNAFALPGGQVFITEALYRRLDTEGELAGVLGHEIGHVIERHGNKRMAQQKLFAGLAAAGGVAGGDVNSQRMSQMIAQMVSMSYGREDELESDRWGVRLCAEAGYDPHAMIGLMEVLDEAGGGGGPPEMLSTHPKPANRVKYIKEVIDLEFPNGVPENLLP